jgi:uncharacterized membrane protein
MYSDLIVMIFSDEEDALKAKQALEQFRNSLFLGVLNAIVVTRDKFGKIVVHEQWELTTNQSNLRKQMPRILVEAFFGQPEEEGKQKLIHAGVDETFAGNIVSALSPNSSLLLSYLYQGSKVDRQQVLEALRQLKGTLYHTTIPSEVEQAILEQAKD